MTDTAKDMPELEPCPKCHGKMIWREETVTFRELSTVYIMCEHACVRTFGKHKTEYVYAAIASAWNTRPQAPAEGEVVWRCAMSEPPETPASTWSEQVLVRFEDGSFDVSSYYNAQTLDGMWLQDIKPKQWCYIQAATRSSQTGAEGLVKAFRDHVNAIPLGHEISTNGRSSYNWGKAYLAVLETILAHLKQTEATNEKREG